jgi:F0F1-type ATP synthase membrane subunit c/vacuolar-type H+-ATPase subunit K
VTVPQADLPTVLRTLRVLWMGFLTSVVVLALVAGVLGSQGDPSLPDVARYLFAAVALGSAALTFVLRRALLIEPMRRGDIDLSKPEGLARFQSAHLVIWALCESVALLALVLYFLTGDGAWSGALFAVSLALLWTHGPRAPEPSGAAPELAR